MYQYPVSSLACHSSPKLLATPRDLQLPFLHLNDCLHPDSRLLTSDCATSLHTIPVSPSLERQVQPQDSFLRS